MKIGIIGSGMVAQVLGGKLAELGHDVMVSSRDIGKEKDTAAFGKLPSPREWAREHNARAGSFSQAARHGEILLNCTQGTGSAEALEQAGRHNFQGKILIDVANPLDFSKGMPPRLTICNDGSLGEQIQEAFPELKVVKALNTVNAYMMINPGMLNEDTSLFICGNDAEAKKLVKDLVLKKWLGWKNIIDLGNISNARGTEMYLPLWARLWGALGTANFNVKVVKKDD